MNIIKTVKCICILIKCSKYLYFIKKAVCLSALFISGVFIFALAAKSKEIMPALRVKK